MANNVRTLVNRSFSAAGYLSILLMIFSLVVVLAPIITRGSKAFIFRGTVEYRRMQLELFERGNREKLEEELAIVAQARQPIFEMLDTFNTELAEMPITKRLKLRPLYNDLLEGLHELLGPFPGDARPAMPRDQYGQTRWDQALISLNNVLFKIEYDYSDPTRMGKQLFVPRSEDFKNTSLVALFPFIADNIEEILNPRWTTYFRFLTDVSRDAHFFGGIWPEVSGTLYLVIGAMLFAVPMGVIAAIYLVEFTHENWFISFLRTCISTLAGVPSIVFALFGLAFFINTLHLTSGKSILAGSLTLGCLILPTIIRTSEEAIRSVPQTYKEAALSLGAGRWHTIATVVLPAALPGVLTGTIISMGRAAGETAPIIFTAAVSVGKPINLIQGKFWEIFSQPTPALPWNIYNLATEHEAVDQIRHVQYGMVLTLVLLVLLLNAAAIVLRARITRRLTG